MKSLTERLGGRSVWTGYLGDIRDGRRGPRVTIALNADQSRQVDRSFDPRFDSCSIDTAVRLFPHLAVYILDTEQV